MAAPMIFKPGGCEDEDEDDFDDDGFCFGGNASNGKIKNKYFDPIAISTDNAAVGRGGFGSPRPKPKPNAPVKNFKRSSDVRNEAENRSLNMGDFQMAIIKGQKQTVLQYLSEGFAVDTILKSGWTGLMYAASNANADIVKILLEKGANPNFHKDMYTVLMAACGAAGYKDKDVLECVDLLLGKGAQVKSYDRYHMSPLMYAAREGQSQVIRRLAESGANLDKQDSRGWTSLTWAASKNHKDAVRSLLEVKANPMMKHCDGQTVIDMVDSTGDDQMLEILEGKKREANISSIPPDVSSTNNNSQTSIQPSSTESYGTTYGELELFLCGLNLSQFVDLFQSQHVDFNTFLRMTEEDLIKMGITQIGVRKKILDGIQAVHKKEWEKSSLTPLQYKKQITCPEALAVVANVSKHTKYITTTIGFLQDQMKVSPQILEELQDGTGPKQLHQHTEDTLRNVTALQHQLTSLKTQLEKTLKTGNYSPPDGIKKLPSGNRRFKLHAVVLSGTILAVIVWKRQYLWERMSHLVSPIDY